VSDTSKTAKSTKRWYYPPTHRMSMCQCAAE